MQPGLPRPPSFRLHDKYPEPPVRWQVFIPLSLLSHSTNSDSLSSMDPKLIRSSPYSLLSTLLAFLLFASLFPSSTSQLSTDFYSFSCPTVELLVRNTVRSAVAFDPTLSGKLLRLLFHDCMVEGCDGSVLVQGNGAELSDPASKSLGGFEVVESAKRLLELLCPGTVSCADILVMVARDAVEMASLKLCTDT